MGFKEPKEGELIRQEDLIKFVVVGGEFETRWKALGWVARYANSGMWRWMQMGVLWEHEWPRPAESNGGLLAPISKLDKGDYIQLKSSKRKIRIIDERKDESGNFEELCEFEDDKRRPIWLPHSQFSNTEYVILEKAS